MTRLDKTFRSPSDGGGSVRAGPSEVHKEDYNRCGVSVVSFRGVLIGSHLNIQQSFWIMWNVEV